jgi:2-dehydropantoate 2-reductase
MAPLEALLPPAILSLQNGVGNEERIAARFGPQRVLAGTITAPVEVIDPGAVQVTKPAFAIGLADFRGDGEGAGSGSILSSLASSFSSAGLPARVHSDARSMKWSKLLMNMIGNAASAILAEPPGVTFADARIADLEIDALREALRVMAAAGIRPLNVEKYPLGTLAPLLRFGPRPLLRTALHRIVGGARGGKMPSLFLDLELGKRGSEVAWYNGAVVRKGVEFGVETPVNRLLTETVQQLAADPQLRAGWRGNFERLAAAAATAAGS